MFLMHLWSCLDWEKESYTAAMNILSPCPSLCCSSPPPNSSSIDSCLRDWEGDAFLEEAIKRLILSLRKGNGFIYFLSGELLSLYVTYDEPWFTNTKFFRVGPGEQFWPNQKIKLKLKAVNMYAAGLYTYSIFALLFWETRQSDSGVSRYHHVATASLIMLSYIFRWVDTED